ncbi:MAG: gliding motility protein GldN [Bacteroidales bacterium]|jgi:gliding motility associated protien GldN|nr:gliding motility protein GldN [Bacteroidales bacterium]
MKKVLCIAFALAGYLATNAQNIIDADDNRNPNDFYQKGIVVGKKAIPYPAVRESDVIWETVIWREIDFNEKFNQFFYFPTSDKSAQGRISLIRLLVRNIMTGEIPIYNDDDMKEPMSPEQAEKMLAGPGTDRKVVKTDAEGNELEDDEGELIYETQHFDGEFDTNSVTKIRLKEVWYIDKQDTRQKVRIVGLQFQFITPPITDPETGQELTKGGPDWSFCIPMDDMRVRQVLVNANAYDDNNDVVERSYDDIFIQRYFDSYIIRESNVYNRPIAGKGGYLTGEDAIIESQMIEDKIFDIESDMWEY